LAAATAVAAVKCPFCRASRPHHTLQQFLLIARAALCRQLTFLTPGRAHARPCMNVQREAAADCFAAVPACRDYDSRYPREP
jgi:hypothetical protein